MADESMDSAKPRVSFAAVGSGGFQYPAFIIPTTKDLGAAATEVHDETFGIRVLLAMGMSAAGIQHYLVNWYGYAPDIAQEETTQNYPVLNQTEGMYKQVKQMMVLHNDQTQTTLTDVKAAFVTYTDDTVENIG